MFIRSSKKYLAALLVLSYLLLGSGLARALVWCVDVDGHSHVKINPAGSCQDACGNAADPGATTPPGLETPLAADDCRDVSLLSSHTQNSHFEQADSSAASDFVLAPFYLSADFSQRQTRLLHAAQPPPPPLSPILAALQTVVLRH